MEVSPAPTPQKAARFYQPELDALRLLAFFGVFFHHKSSPYQVLPYLPATPLVIHLTWLLHVAGAYGVSLFFLLSSYLITRLLRKEVAATGRLDLRAFYIRRSLRIWPLYFAFLALLYALLRLGVTGDLPAGFFLASLFFVNNWYIIVHSYVWFPAVLLWTISVEEQFYFSWPVLVRSAARPRIRTLAVGAIILSHLTLLGLHAFGVTHDFRVFFNTFTEIQFFGLGALLALWAEDHPVSLAAPRRALLAALGLGSLVFAAAFDTRTNYLSLGPFTYNVGFAFIAVGAAGLFRAFLGAPAHWFPRPLLFLGRISYGLYVFNLASGYLARFLCRGRTSIVVEFFVTAALNLLFAVVSWYLLERPFLRLKSRFEIIRTRNNSAEATAVAS